MKKVFKTNKIKLKINKRKKVRVKKGNQTLIILIVKNREE